MPPRAGVNWYHDSLTPTLGLFAVKANFAARQAAEELAEEIEVWMKANAPWQDRTGDARAGLSTEVRGKGSFRTEIYLFHTVDYGIWLEVIQDGAYAIIVPALEHFGNVRAWTHFAGVVGKATLGRFAHV